MLYIAPGILIHSCGDIVHFLDLKTMTYTFQPVRSNSTYAVKLCSNASYQFLARLQKSVPSHSLVFHLTAAKIQCIIAIFNSLNFMKVYW